MWELSCDYRDIIHEFTASDVPSLGHAIYGLNRPFLTRFSGLSHGSGLLRDVFASLGEGIETHYYSEHY